VVKIFAFLELEQKFLFFKGLKFLKRSLTWVIVRSGQND